MTLKEAIESNLPFRRSDLHLWMEVKGSKVIYCDSLSETTITLDDVKSDNWVIKEKETIVTKSLIEKLQKEWYYSEENFNDFLIKRLGL